MATPVFTYILLFASCLALCLGLTLLLVTRIPDLLTPELKVRLLQIAAFFGIAFLLCTRSGSSRSRWLALCQVGGEKVTSVGSVSLRAARWTRLPRIC